MQERNKHASVGLPASGGYMGLIGDNGKRNGNYYSIIGYIQWGYLGIMENMT